MEFLGNHAGFKNDHYNMDRAIRWMLRAQQQDGSWYGHWGISYIYGTWAGITGLMAAGVSKDHPALRKAVRWLTSIQYDDGGFGESCQSDIQKRYNPLGYSTPSQTAWAADALISAAETDTPEFKKQSLGFLRSRIRTMGQRATRQEPVCPGDFIFIITAIAGFGLY